MKKWTTIGIKVETKSELDQIKASGNFIDMDAVIRSFLNKNEGKQSNEMYQDETIEPEDKSELSVIEKIEEELRQNQGENHDI